MKNFGIFLIGIAFAVSVTACKYQSANDKKQSVSSLANQKKSPGRIEFSKEIHNFGTLKEGEVVVFSFQYRNEGESPFLLTRAATECGCITVKYSKDEIPAHTGSTVDVIFNTAGEWGNQIKTVVIETSTGEKKTLRIGAFVENKNFNIDLSN
jgi:VanZ family protein